MEFNKSEDGLIYNYLVVKDAAQVRLLTGAGLIDAKVVRVDAANDLALLKADGRFAPLLIAASRTGLLGGCWSSSFSLSGRGNTLKRELQRGFPDIGLQGFAPKVLAHGHHGGNRVAGSAGFAVRAKNGAVFAISFLNSSLTQRRAAVEFHAWFTILFRNKKHNYGSQSCN